MAKKMRLIRFDWAMKRLLRDKANFDVLEGFLSVLLQEKITIKSILSSQANKEDDKYNDVDILVENTKGELVIVEVQNTKQIDYFHRILYGASKAIAEYIIEGQPYKNVKKVIYITIAYFDLGQGKDYVYHGTTQFRGIHKGDILSLSFRQIEKYKKKIVADIYPEYWIIKAGIFDENNVQDELDEWIYFFKMGEVLDTFTAAGLEEAKVKLDKMKLSREERKEYEAYVERLRKLASKFVTDMDDFEQYVEKSVLRFHSNGVAVSVIANSLEISEEQVKKIIEESK